MIVSLFFIFLSSYGERIYIYFFLITILLVGEPLIKNYFFTDYFIDKPNEQRLYTCVYVKWNEKSIIEKKKTKKETKKDEDSSLSNRLVKF